MNTPGTLGGANWAWRFTWDMVGPEPGRVLGLLTAASGRGRFELLGIGVPPPGLTPSAVSVPAERTRTWCAGR